MLVRGCYAGRHACNHYKITMNMHFIHSSSIRKGGAIQWNLSKADTIGTNKIVHYREGVLWSGVYYTLCGLYLGFSKCPL